MQAHTPGAERPSEKLLARSVFNALITNTATGGLLQPGLQKLREHLAAAMTCGSPAAGQRLQSGKNQARFCLQQSPPHFAQAHSSGACGPPAGPMRSVSSSKVACVCLPCLLGGCAGRQRAGCGARTGPAFRPSCNVKVIYMYIYICMHMNMCI